MAATVYHVNFLVVASEKDSKGLSCQNRQNLVPKTVRRVIQGVTSIGSVMSVQILGSEIRILPFPRRNGYWWPSENSSKNDLFLAQKLIGAPAEAFEINIVNVISHFVHFYFV